MVVMLFGEIMKGKYQEHWDKTVVWQAIKAD